MQSSSRRKNASLHKLMAIVFCLSFGFGQQVFAQPAEGDGPDPQNNMRGGQRWRQKMMNLPPEKREAFLQRVRERRGQGQNFQTQEFMQDVPAPGPNASPVQMGPGPGIGINPEQPFNPNRGGMRKRQGGGNGGRQGFGFGGKALDLSQLNLSEKQKGDILSLRAKHSEHAKSIQKNLRGKRMELRTMLFSPDLNRKALQDKRNELRGLQNQMDDIMIEDFLGVRSVLSEEQIKRLAETNMPNVKRKAATQVQPKNE